MASGGGGIRDCWHQGETKEGPAFPMLRSWMTKVAAARSIAAGIGDRDKAARASET